MGRGTDMKQLGRLLVVDDEAPQLQALCTVLQQDGHQVVGCTAPAEALEHLRDKRFDVMLSDLNMPQMDGIALTREATRIDPDVVPILMTGQGTVSTAVEAMKVGALDYVLKPFRIAAIRPVLARAFEMRRLRLNNRELQEAVERRTRLLEAANDELDAFAARVAHDLRGPVMGMLGFARVVQEQSAGRLEPHTWAHLGRIVSAGERAERMIRDLLAFARLGESPLQRRTVSLDEVLRCAREMVEPQAGSRMIDWIVAPLPSVQGDASLLEQVFVNLLSNAVKYTRQRELARVEVGHRVDAQDGHVIWVHDNGVGFDPAYADRLFSPFQRLHGAEFEGTGFGLANVKRIVERHGGTVSAQSQPAQGATFSFTLPA
jgi:signal transduction histidine kinase